MSQVSGALGIPRLFTAGSAVVAVCREAGAYGERRAWARQRTKLSWSRLWDQMKSAPPNFSVLVRIGALIRHRASGVRRCRMPVRIVECRRGPFVGDWEMQSAAGGRIPVDARGTLRTGRAIRTRRHPAGGLERD